MPICACAIARECASSPSSSRPPPAGGHPVRCCRPQPSCSCWPLRRAAPTPSCCWCTACSGTAPAMCSPRRRCSRCALLVATARAALPRCSLPAAAHMHAPTPPPPPRPPCTHRAGVRRHQRPRAAAAGPAPGVRRRPCLPRSVPQRQRLRRGQPHLPGCDRGARGASVRRGGHLFRRRFQRVQHKRAQLAAGPHRLDGARLPGCRLPGHGHRHSRRLPARRRAGEGGSVCEERPGMPAAPQAAE